MERRDYRATQVLARNRRDQHGRLYRKRDAWYDMTMEKANDPLYNMFKRRINNDGPRLRYMMEDMKRQDQPVYQRPVSRRHYYGW